MAVTFSPGTGTAAFFNINTTSSTATTYSNPLSTTTAAQNAAINAQFNAQMQMLYLSQQQHQGSLVPPPPPPPPNFPNPMAGAVPYTDDAPPRNFSRYLNASDLLEEFVRYCQTVGGVRQRDFMALPVELFIHWLMIRAAEADGEPRPADVPDPKVQLLTLAKSPWGSRCRDCGRFIPEHQALMFCSGAHFDRYRSKQLQAA